MTEHLADDTHYEWELEDEEGEWQAGGSANDLEAVRREGYRYLATHSADGPCRLIIRRHQTTTLQTLEIGGEL